MPHHQCGGKGAPGRVQDGSLQRQRQRQGNWHDWQGGQGLWQGRRRQGCEQGQGVLVKLREPYLQERGLQSGGPEACNVGRSSGLLLLRPFSHHNSPGGAACGLGVQDQAGRKSRHEQRQPAAEGRSRSATCRGADRTHWQHAAHGGATCSQKDGETRRR